MQKARRVKISKKEGTEGEEEGKGLEPFLATLFFSVRKKKRKGKKRAIAAQVRTSQSQSQHCVTSRRQTTNVTPMNNYVRILYVDGERRRF